MRRQFSTGAALLAIPLLGGACFQLFPLSDLTGGSDGGPDDGGAPADGAIESADPDAAAAADGLSSYAAQVLEAGAIVYLRFDEPQNSSVAVNQAIAPGKCPDGSYPLSGVDRPVPGALASDRDPAVHISQPTNANYTRIVVPSECADFNGTATPFSVEFWVKPDTSAADNFVVDHANWNNPSPGQRDGWAIYFQQGGGLECDFGYWNSGEAHAFADPLLTSDKWHHVAVVTDGTNRVAYIDGQPQTPGPPVAVSMPVVNQGWSIGGQNCDHCTGGFPGAIDELAIYPYALGQQWVQAHYLAGTR